MPLPDRARPSTLALALALLTGAKAARAELPSFDAHTWRPSTDPNASLVLEPAITPGPGVFSFGAATTYAYRPLTLRMPATGDVAARPIEHALELDAIANLGIGQRFAIGVLAPVMVYQTGTSSLPKTASDVSKIPATAMGDVGVSMKGSLVRNDNGGFGLAALGYVSIPTGNGHAFAGDGSPTVTARLLAEYTLLVATAQVSLGYTLRTRNPVWPDRSIGGYTFGDAIPWSIGVGLRPGVFGLDPGNRQRWEVAAHGWLPAGPVGPFGLGDPGSAALSPALLGVSDRIELGHYRDAYVLAGADIGLNGAVGVPVARVVASIGWAPRAHDMDGDGVEDDVDGCPEIPEDKDGFEDSDGCPEVDNDDDGVLDRDDACPNEAGVESTDPAKNGCPSADTDGDGIEDAKDACPTRPEDVDGFEDDDGCPDLDNDRDGIADRDDACPNEAGEASSDPSRHGCPSRDRDGDTFANDLDRCPDEPETFNGVADDDGCPDEGGKPLVTVDAKNVVRLASPIHVTNAAEPDVDPASAMTLRALAATVNAHADWSLAVGVKPGKGDSTKAQLDALTRALAVVRELAQFCRRDGAAEAVGWDAVKKNAQAGSEVAFLVLVTPPIQAPKPVQTTPGAPPKSPPPPYPAPLTPLTSPSPL